MTLKHLLIAFKESGYPKSRTWIYRHEAKGNLIMPRSTTDFKKAQGSRKLSAVRELTEQQIHDIVSSFLPGGSGFYDYRKTSL